MKLWLQDNNIEIYSTHNEGKSEMKKPFIRIPKNKIYEYVTALSTLLVKEYNNVIFKTIKMKYVYVKLKTYIDFNSAKPSYGIKPPKFKIIDHVQISKDVNIFKDLYIKLVRKIF